MSFTIPSGCYALVTRSETDLDYKDEYGRKHAVWPAGLHFPYFSRTGVSFFVTKRSTIFDIPVTRCITKDNKSMVIILCVFDFRRGTHISVYDLIQFRQRHAFNFC